MDEFRIRARKMTNYMKEAFSASECALSKKPTPEREVNPAFFTAYDAKYSLGDIYGDLVLAKRKRTL
jgi:hypothetical protein